LRRAVVVSTVSVNVKVPNGTVVVLGVTVKPVGLADTATLMLSENPFSGVMVTVLTTPVVPTDMSLMFGLIDTVKSGPGGVVGPYVFPPAYRV
jgi:hypothetical protein